MPEGADTDRAPAGRRTLVQLNLRRAALAAALLAGLFALLFLVLLPRGDGDGSVLPARLVDTPTGATDASVGVRPGRLARDFAASNLEGRRLHLSELRGHPVVINFWATWCTSCLAEMPALEEQRRAHRSEGLVIVAVNVGERPADARRFIDALELFDLTVALDPDLTVADAYGVRGLPHSVFIDRNGVVQALYQGQLDAETMERYVQAAVDAVSGGEPPARLRFLTVVPREHVLEVLPDADEPGRVLFVSRRFRCDSVYCGRPAVERLRATAGVSEVVLHGEGAAPALAVTFDAEVIALDEVVAVLADALRSHEDLLYTQELEVRYPEGRP